MLANAFVPISAPFWPFLILPSRWLPLGQLQHCLAHTGCKLIIVDPERAHTLEPVTSQLRKEVGTVAFLVMEDTNRSWRDMESFDEVVNAYSEQTDSQDLLSEQIDPEDNATIIFTSGSYPHCTQNLLSPITPRPQERRACRKAF